MRRFVIALGLVLSSQWHASAADVIMADNLPPPDPERFGWDGGYVGVSAGYAWLRDIDHSFTPPLRDRGEDWNYGAYGGYLFQFGQFVAGPEIEVAKLDIQYEFLNFIKVENAYSIRARAGMALDRFLVTGHAGAVYATTNFMGLKDWGYELGVGVDYAATDNIIVGAHYSHQGFNNFDGTQIDAQVDLLKGRVGFKF